MPQLTRLRFVNVGHDNARMDDLTVPLCDAEGRALDSTLWLRNGGGKSSLLNLVFSLLNPNRRAFLGAKADQGQRRLEDYVLDTDRAVVLAEWLLDDVKDETPRWYLTGGFYEWRQNNLERLFFAAYVQRPQLILETVPLEGENGQRLTLYGFKQAWQNLGRAYPQLDAQETDHQGEWQRILREQAGLDSELFSYQSRMNAREGGADELFRFKDTDQFVDFFLELVLPEEWNRGVARNLETYRTTLRERLKLWQPSLELIRSLTCAVRPMLEVASQRGEHRRQLGELRLRLERFRAHLEARVETLSGEVGLLEAREQEFEHALEGLRAEARTQEDRAVAFGRARLEEQVGRSAAEQRQLEERLREVKRARLTWKAAVPLVEVVRNEGHVRSLEALLQLQSAELAPTWAEVHAAAQALSAALSARAAEARRRAQHQRGVAHGKHEEARAARRAARDAQGAAGAARQRAEDRQAQLEGAHDARARLEVHGTVHPGELLSAALERWTAVRNAAEFEDAVLVGELGAVHESLQTLDRDCDHARGQRTEAEGEVSRLQRLLEEAYEAHKALERDSVLVRVLEGVDAEALTAASLSLLRERRLYEERRLLELNASLAHDEALLEHLLASGLLPPTRDVRVVCDALKSRGITASPGWEHLAAGAVGREYARAFIDRYPELMQGVLVRDAHFERVRDALEGLTDNLDAPVVVVPRSLAFTEVGGAQVGPVSDSRRRIVVGPSSDAHFDKEAAKLEQQATEVRIQQDRLRHEEAEREALELRDAADRLERFITRYPRAWLTDHEAALRGADQRLETWALRLADLERRRREGRKQLGEIGARREALSGVSRGARAHLHKLETHHEHYGAEALLQKLEANIASFRTEAQRLEGEAERQDALAVRAEAEARDLEGEAAQLDESAEGDEQRARNVTHLKGEMPSPQPGDVDGLRARHKNLCDVLEHRTDGHQLQTELAAARRAREASYERFRAELEESLDDSLDEREVRAALSDVPDERSVRARAKEAEVHKADVIRALGAAEAQMQVAQTALQHHREEHPQLQAELSVEARDRDEGELERRAREAQALADKARLQAAEHEREVLRLRQDKQKLAQSREELRSGHKDLIRNLDHYEDLLKDVLEDASAGSDDWIPPPDERVERDVSVLEKVLKRARQRSGRLLEQRQALYQAYRACLDEANFDFVRPLRQWTPEALEIDAESLLHDLDTRERNVREALEESERHREVIVTEILTVADRGVRLLRGLVRSSKLPDTAQMLAGKEFLKIGLTTTDSPSEQRARIGALIDDIIGEDQVPEGLKLVQRAVRKLAQPIQVAVLFPDVDAPPRYVPITEMAKESGGERLTSAVLLYCALARQRAKARGRDVRVTSSLLLDNPVGTASRAEFLELQRETAGAMNIQLVYATGILDFEAIRVLPNVVRLRNERRNARNQQLLEVVRIVRPEDDSGAALGVN